MQGQRKKWHLIAYDIRDEKRLRRLHYYLKKEAVALQKSVFLLHAGATRLREIEGKIKALVNLREDDVRRYPILSPKAIWCAGTQASSLESLYAGTSGTSSSPGSLQRLFHKIFKRRKA